MHPGSHLCSCNEELDNSCLPISKLTVWDPIVNSYSDAETKGWRCHWKGDSLLACVAQWLSLLWDVWRLFCSHLAVSYTTLPWRKWLSKIQWRTDPGSVREDFKASTRCQLATCYLPLAPFHIIAEVSFKSGRPIPSIFTSATNPGSQCCWPPAAKESIFKEQCLRLKRNSRFLGKKKLNAASQGDRWQLPPDGIMGAGVAQLSLAALQYLPAAVQN